MATAAALSCPKCASPLSDEALAPGSEGALASEVRLTCPGCDSSVEALVFPAFRQAATAGLPAEAVRSDEESSCFFHPASRAMTACDRCGRFLCALCDILLGDRHVCPACLKLGPQKGKLEGIEKSRMMHGQTALWIAVLPILFWPMTIITGPLALFLACLWWNKPGGITGTSKAWIFFAALFGLLQAGAWVFGLVALFG